MPLNLFDRSVRQLAATMKKQVGRTITYHRPLDSMTILVSERITVWEGQTVFRTNSQTKTFLDWSGKDFLIVRTDLKLSETSIEPLAGDFITRYDEDGNTETYALSAPTGEPLFRKSDPQGYILRIHTKKVKYGS